MNVPAGINGDTRMAAIHRKRIEEIHAAAADMAGTLRLMEQRAGAVLAAGGTLDIQKQVAFMTGSLARLMKDWGVVEQLQSQGAVAKPLPRFG